jgi:DNA gyrase subunit A
MSSITGYVTDKGAAVVAPRDLPPREFAPVRSNGSRLAAVVETTADQALDVFTDAGLCYRASLEGRALERGVAEAVELVSLISGEFVCAVHPARVASHYALVTERGLVKRIEKRTLAKADADGLVAFNVPLHDRLVAVVPHGADAELLISTAGGKLLRLDLGLVRPILTADAGGVAGIALADGDRVVCACRADGSELLVVHESGAAKRVPLDEYPVKGRGTGGVLSALVDKPARRPAGDVVFAAAVNGQPPKLFTERGWLIAVDLEQVAEGTRAAVSRPALRFAEGDRPRGLVA